MSKNNSNLTAEQKLILFEEGTERPGSSELNYENKNKVSELLNPINFFIWLVVSFKDIF